MNNDPADDSKQTDFGQIYFNVPEEIFSPASTEELATVLRRCHSASKQVRIRNTAHSVNGQTLTDGIQINIGNIKRIQFDRTRMEVTVGAGNSWHEVLEGIEFPKHSPPIFTLNPHQRIKIGGTASVGGVGPTSAKYGGLWNHILRLKLVTMTGEIIECSRDLHEDFFKYSLGGFGRIAVISELTLKVIPSDTHILGLVLPYFHWEEYFNSLKNFAADEMICGITGTEQLRHTHFFRRCKRGLHLLFLFIEMSRQDRIKETLEKVRRRYRRTPLFSIAAGDLPHQRYLALRKKLSTRRDFVYTSPPLSSLCHPWSDFVVAEENYRDFISEAKRLVHKHRLDHYMEKWNMSRMANTDLFACYAIKKRKGSEKDYPLCLDIHQAREFSFLSIIPLSVPRNLIKDSMNLIEELTDLIFSLNGKMYLYGIHNLSPQQVEIQFGRKTIEKWQRLKDELDPRHLLNIGVIEHLDAMV